LTKISRFANKKISMAKGLKYENVVKTVNEFCTYSMSKGLSHQYTQDEFLNGREITINNKKYIHFGSCGYLGLELDRRLKEAAIDAVQKYGTLFACSRIFVSSTNYLELEELLQKMFNTNILLAQNTSLGHYAVMPTIIGGNDVVIYDQQAHFSMQDLSYKLSHNGTHIEVLRHNMLNELEKKIESHKSKYDKIWYIIDGVYSMFGDLAPIKDIVKLLDKHKKLYLYVDDAHGMSWAGKNGSGFTLSQTNLHPKMILGTSIAKGFGACGGVFLFNDIELRDKVRKWGGPLSHSGPQEPATVAAAIASAKIHLSGEIYDIQKSLQDKIQFCNDIMEQYKVPLVSNCASPIFFVACGLPKVGFNMVERLMGEGFYTNIGIFPAVPENCTGVRFTMTNHIQYEDIENLAKAIAKHLPLALKEEGRTIQDIYKSFRKFTDFEKRLGPPDSLEDFSQTGKDEVTIVVEKFNTIKNINQKEWDSIFGDRAEINYENICILENVFTNNSCKENNWEFFYYLVKNNNEIIAATFLTAVLTKDDMLSSSAISEKIEKTRIDNPYYLTSVYLSTGTQLTYGNHLYVNKNNKNWEKALMLLLDELWKEQENIGANVLILRDFENNDNELTTFFIDNGFVKIDMATSCVVENLKGMTFDRFFTERLNTKKRFDYRSRILNNEHLFNVEYKKPNENELKHYYQLYLNVKQNNFEINSYALPYKLFEQIAKEKNWEILELKHIETGKVASVTFCVFNENNYCPMIMGIDYSLGKSLNIYKQTLYRFLLRAIDLRVDNLHLGVTATDAKYNLGATKKEHIAFIQTKDTYNQDVINSMAFGE
jgi:7-keto-8-aminopelargonate synthetase-like enzyme